MFTHGLKDLSITELADETGIDRSKIYTYINTATPDDYEYTRGNSNGVTSPPYLLSERDIEFLSMIHELAQSHSIREVKEILSDESEDSSFAKKQPDENTEKQENVVPYFIANYIDENEDKSLPEIMTMPKTNLNKTVYNYLFGRGLSDEEKKQRQITFTNSWVNGYDRIQDISIFEKINLSAGDFYKLKEIYNDIGHKNSPEKRFVELELYIIEQSAERGLQDSIRQGFKY